MAIESSTEIETITGRDGSDAELQNPAGDISTGVDVAVRTAQSVTLYLSAAGSVNVTIEASPNDGEDWFTLPESPIAFSSAGDNLVLINYDVTKLRLTGSNTTDVQAIVREVV